MTLKLLGYTVNDVCVHPNQGELISCDQAGRIKQWDLSENICTHELVRSFLACVSRSKFERSKTPAGDVPIRSVTLASDGSCLVAGNNKVADRMDAKPDSYELIEFFSRENATCGRLMKRAWVCPAFKLLPNFRRTINI
jgi:hypothetical protein